MKKKLLQQLGLLVLLIVPSIQLKAQCVPNNDTISGIEPDTLAVAYVGIPYEQVIYFRLPHDTVATIGPFTVALWIDSLVLDSYTGLPPTFSLSCNNPSCTVLGGSNGCAAITGTATASDLGIHPLKVYVTTYVSDTLGTPIGGFSDSIDFYFLDVQIPSGMNTLGLNEWNVGACFPNPANGTIHVPVTTPKSGAIEMSVIDISGRSILTKSMIVKRGSNDASFDVYTLDDGMYFLNIKQEGWSSVVKFQLQNE